MVKNILKVLNVIILLTFVLIVVGCTPESYTIEFIDYDGTIISSQEVTSSEELEEPETPVREGYTFNGWDKDFSEVSSDLKVYAKYSVNEYEIELLVDNKVYDNILIDYNEELESLPTPTKNGYAFLGWFIEDEKIEAPFTFAYTNDITLKAKWELEYEPIDSDNPIFIEFIEFVRKTERWSRELEKYSLSNNTNVKVSYLNTTYETNGNVLYKVDVNDNYYYEETNIGNVNYGKYIVEVKDNKTLLYSIEELDGKKYVYTDYLGDADAFTEFMYLSNMVIFSFDTTGFSDEMNFEKIDDNHFKVDYNYANLSDEELDRIIEIMEMEGITKNILKEVDSSLELIFDEETNILDMKVSMTNLKYENMNFDVSYDYRCFHTDYINKVVINDNYIKYPVSSLEAAIYTTAINKTITSDLSPNPHFYKFSLQKGQYLFESEKDWGYNFTLLDVDGHVVDLGAIWDENKVKYNNTFKIPESGIYYLKFDNSSFSDYTFKISKLPYTSSFASENIDVNDVVNGIVEGNYDFNIYKINYSGNGVLDIKSTSDLKIYSVNESGVSSPLTYLNGHYYSLLKDGENYIYVSNYTPIIYQFETDIFEDNTNGTPNLNTMDNITTDFSDVFLTGYGTNDDFLRLDVDNAATYKLEVEVLGDLYTPSISIHKADGTLVSSSKTNYLEAGTYYIKITCPSSVVSLSRVKYVILEDINETKDFTIQDYSGVGSIPYIQDMLPTINSVIYHRFTLTEESSILINTTNGHQLLDEEGNNFVHYTYNHNYYYYTLPAGTYRIRIIPLNSRLSITNYTFKVAKYTTPKEDDYTNPINMPDIILNEEITTVYNYIYDVDVLKFEVTKARLYYFNVSSYGVLYDSNNEVMANIGGNYNGPGLEKYLEVGTYYLIIDSYLTRQIGEITKVLVTNIER